MISGFQSREFGFGMEVTGKEFCLVNEYCNEKKYCDEKAAKHVKGTEFKQLLNTNTPFVKEFEYRASNEGYRCYEHMVLQMEDCIDVMRVLKPDFDILFLFDHSRGHDTQQEDG